MEVVDFRNKIAKSNGYASWEKLVEHSDRGAHKPGQLLFLADQAQHEYELEMCRPKELWAVEAQEPKNIFQLEQERFKWACETFPEATAISSLRKLEGEIKEIEADILAGKKEPIEYADALMCLFDSAGRHGITPQDIVKAFSIKLEINKNRIWAKNPDNSYSHVKVHLTCGLCKKQDETVMAVLPDKPTCPECWADFIAWTLKKE